MFEKFLIEVAKPHRQSFINLILLVFFLFLIGFALTLLFINSKDLSFDLSFTHKIQRIHNPLFLDLMDFVSLVGSGFFVLIPFSLLIFWLYRRGSKHEALMLPIVFVAPAVSELAKIAFSRPRPIEGQVLVYGQFPGFSFPSSHVLFYTLFFGFIAFLALSLPEVKPIVRTLLFSVSILLVILIGISRIYLGAHWPTDVIAGYLVGLALLEILVVGYLKEVYLPKVRNKQNKTNN